MFYFVAAKGAKNKKRRAEIVAKARGTWVREMRERGWGRGQPHCFLKTRLW